MQNESFIVPPWPWCEGFTATVVFTPPNAMEELSPKKAVLFLQGERAFFVSSLFFFAVHGEQLCCHPAAVNRWVLTPAWLLSSLGREVLGFL